MPRIPVAPDLRAFADAGKELARLHLDYETLEPWPFQWIETPDVPLSYRVEIKMKLSNNRTTKRINDSLTMGEILPETFGQVVRVSIETMKIVNALPAEYAG